MKRIVFFLSSVLSHNDSLLTQYSLCLLTGTRQVSLANFL